MSRIGTPCIWPIAHGVGVKSGESEERDGWFSDGMAVAMPMSMPMFMESSWSSCAEPAE